MRLRSEPQVDHDPSRAWFLRKVFRLRKASAHGLETSVRQLRVLVGLRTCVSSRRSDDHAESLGRVSCVRRMKRVEFTGGKALTFDFCAKSASWFCM
jgi:hypothetical protein